ncbi:MAG: phosphoribosyl-ATP diphosphatase [Alphaproteobacteria bacterium]|nr:phosphoribosyl-ATP diphosphatase [Alphaproteobacteria bacterium]
MSDLSILNTLFETIEKRKKSDPEKSYTAKLFAKGRNKIAQKLGEEATETVIEAMTGDKKKLAEESADLLYHLLVVWADVGITPQDVTAVIEARMDITADDKKKRKGGD